MVLHSLHLHFKLNKYKQYCIHLHEKCIILYTIKYIVERENLLNPYMQVIGLYL